jgi:hypothetical protein
MTLTKREIELFAKIQQWETTYFDYESTDFERTYQKWLQKGFAQIGDHKQEKFLSIIDNLLFHLHAIIQNSRYHEDARNRLILQAQVFNPEVEQITDLRLLPIEQLNFIASQQIAKQRLISLGQGGVSGMGGVVLLGTDLPAMLTINLRAIQLIALSYGYELKHPFEMMMALKVFHVATLPKDLQKGAWENLWTEIPENGVSPLFYDGQEEITDASWISQPIRQLVKGMVITMLRKKLIQGVPLVGMVFGATINYQFSRKVTNIAQRFYQKRNLLERK